MSFFIPTGLFKNRFVPLVEQEAQETEDRQSFSRAEGMMSMHKNTNGMGIRSRSVLCLGM